jgi:polysaccharide export outer membrane protein
MKFIRIVLLLGFPLYFFSCNPQQRIPYYLQNAKDTSGNTEVKIPELRIQKNDLLSIRVYSASTIAEIDELYNLRTTRGTSSGAGQAEQISGFLVDANGNIEYPRLGSFHAEGLTKDELAEQIKKRLTEPVELLKDPSVLIRFQNLKITVLGEVGNQGVLNVPGERVTILEAVGLAGGISDEGLKNSVKVIREIDGKREIGLIDLSSDSLFHSPYYNLMQNDVVLVQPSKRKRNKVEQDQVIRRITFGLGLISSIALLYNIFTR